ncbi:HEPN domain-containing protein [Anabaena azotica]|uniref:HEPN domain-containing protein n=1 Tax=Anabaena azotica TaxID=197653 RepID=UPI0039A63698
MPKSARFRILTRELNRLKKQFLPKISPTGLYSDRQLVKTLAYRVLAHAEIESYLEDRVWEAVLNAKRAWDSTGKTSRTLICLLGFSSLTMDKPPDTLNKTSRISQDEHDKRLKISKKIDSAINNFRWVKDNNHGVKEANILALLLPIGIDSNDLDPAWLATMNTFGKERGIVAHTSATSYMTVQPPDPANELNTVKQITQELLRIDQLINNLMQ